MCCNILEGIKRSRVSTCDTCVTLCVCVAECGRQHHACYPEPSFHPFLRLPQVAVWGSKGALTPGPVVPSRTKRVLHNDQVVFVSSQTVPVRLHDPLFHAEEQLFQKHQINEIILFHVVGKNNWHYFNLCSTGNNYTSVIL